MSRNVSVCWYYTVTIGYSIVTSLLGKAGESWKLRLYFRKVILLVFLWNQRLKGMGRVSAFLHDICRSLFVLRLSQLQLPAKLPVVLVFRCRLIRARWEVTRKPCPVSHLWQVEVCLHTGCSGPETHHTNHQR